MTKREKELVEALRNVRQALFDGNWSLAIGFINLAIGEDRKAA